MCPILFAVVSANHIVPYGRVYLGSIIVGEAVIFEEPYPVTFLIVENVGLNCVREVVNWMRLPANREVYYLRLGRLYRDNPDSLVAGWIEDKRRKVRGVLRNRKCGHIRISSHWIIPVENWR